MGTPILSLKTNSLIQAKGAFSHRQSLARVGLGFSAVRQFPLCLKAAKE